MRERGVLVKSKKKKKRHQAELSKTVLTDKMRLTSEAGFWEMVAADDNNASLASE